MKPARMFFFGLASVAAVAFPAAAVAAGAGFQHDLFARPPLEMLKPVTPETVKTVTPPPAPPEWKPELRAIIAGPRVTLVNVEGRIVQMGQDIDGYRLVEVKDRRATFVKDKVRYALDLVNVKGTGASDSPAAAPRAAASPSPAAAAPVAAPAAATAPAPTAPVAAPVAVPAPAAPAGPAAPGPLMGLVKASDVLARRETPAPETRGSADPKAAERRGG